MTLEERIFAICLDHNQVECDRALRYLRKRKMIFVYLTHTHAHMHHVTRMHQFMRARFSLTQEHVFAICLDHKQEARESYDIFIVQPCRVFSCISIKCWCAIVFI
jgi:hypothetical protein